MRGRGQEGVKGQRHKRSGKKKKRDGSAAVDHVEITTDRGESCKKGGKGHFFFYISKRNRPSVWGLLFK